MVTTDTKSESRTELQSKLIKVNFSDPLSEDSRKIKKLVLINAIALLVIIPFDFRINSVFGLIVFDQNQVEKTTLVGLASLTLGYFFIRFLLAYFIDYSAWEYKKEEAKLDYYRETFEYVRDELHRHEKTIEATAAIVERSDLLLKKPSWFEKLSRDPIPEMSDAKLSSVIRELASQIGPTWSAYRELHQRCNLELDRLDDFIAASRLTKWRLGTRFVSLFVLDLLLPAGLSVYAFTKSWKELLAVIAKIAA